MLLAGLVLAAAVFGYGVDRAYHRSLPARPAVVPLDADVARLLAPSLVDRVRRALLGAAAERHVAGPKLIALTFDDGPYPVGTPLLLALLRAEHVPATFFLIGRDAEQYPGLVREIARAGDEIANHTQTHPNLAALDAAEVTAELAEGAATLSHYTTEPSVRELFRPPHGRYTATTLETAQRDGYVTVLWTDDPGDWRNVPAATLEAHVLARATRPEILLLHNGRPATVAMLSAVIGRFRRAGYTFVTVSELLRRVTAEQLDRAARSPLTAVR